MQLSKWDEYFIHQTDVPIETVADNDRYWVDSCYMGAMGVRENMFLSTGMRAYPNTRNMAAYALLWRDGVQHNARVTREIANDRAEMSVGPFHITILEPLTRWRFELEETEQFPISYDIEFEGLTQPYLCHTTSAAAIFGDNYSHVLQPCRYNGRVTADGRSYAVRDWIGPRDRFWGLHSMFNDVGLHLWVIAQFEEFTVFVYHQEQKDGAIRLSDGAIMSKSGNVALRSIEHELVFEPGTRRVTKGTLVLGTADGGRVRLECTPGEIGLAAVGAWCGSDWSEYMGHLHYEYDAWDRRDPATSARLSRFLTHRISTVECDGQKGTAFFECAVSRKHVRYGPAL